MARRGIRVHVLWLCVAVSAAAGCAEPFVPVVTPVVADRVKNGGPHEALVLLPNNAVASVFLHYVYGGGRLSISKIGIVNHHPGRVTLFAAKSRIYVDDGEPLQLASYKEFDGKASNVDFHILKGLPEGATGTWLVPRRRIVTRSTIRGPVVLLFYSVDGHDGFVKVCYRSVWDLTG